MPAFLIPVIAWMLSGFVARVLTGAGLTLLSFAALKPLIDGFLDQMTSYLGAVPVATKEVMLMAGISNALSIIGGALLTRAAIEAASVSIGKKK